MVTHLVWDWNGTLLDDFHVIVTATNETIETVGGKRLSADQHRDAFYRPIIDFYSDLAGRRLTVPEFTALDRTFHLSYRRGLDTCGLTHDARDAITSWPGSQSLLSMWFHDELVPLVEHHGLTAHFDRVDGLRAGAGSESKHPHLVTHLAALGIAPGDTVLIGDSVDDALAADRAGARCVLYSGGFTSEAKLREVGVPVAASLTEAVRLARLG